MTQRGSGKWEEFTVWEEGYLCSGMEGRPASARIIGQVKAASFRDACIALCKDNKDFDEERLDVWGCRLFDNEDDARKQFG